ncbi:hypothetical protein TWF970_006506 [Orbilia oligospora]|uniref:Uncharacterized protein n=1 Tax=Orbilia oligospora TaxID=2813651 RepID=A0A7C8R5X1_ORBOL|nr:hypothetical protein TWF970_006506 [Orbilia oligospora]
MMVLNRTRSLPSVSLGTKCTIELQSSVTFDAVVDAIIDVTVDPPADVTVNGTVNDTSSATTSPDPTTNGLPDIFLITLGIPPYLNITGLGAPGIESLDIDPRVYMMCKGKAIINILAGLDQRYKRYDKIMGLSQNGEMYQKLAVGLIFMTCKANAYSEDFLSHIAASSQRSLKLPFLDMPPSAVDPNPPALPPSPASATSLVAVSPAVAVSSSSSPASSLTLEELLEKRLKEYLAETKMASKQPDESSFAPASLGFGQRTDFEETDASTSHASANSVDQHVHGLGILGTEEDIKRHEEAVAQLTKLANPILARIGRIFVSIGDERHKVEGCREAMLRKDQKALVLKLDGLKSDGDAYLRQLDDVIQSFDSAQKWHNVLLGQMAELVKLQRAEAAAVSAAIAAAADDANTTLDGKVQQGSPLMVEGPAEGVVSPPLTSPIKAPTTERQDVAHQETGPAKTALLILSHLSDQMRWVEIDLVKLWDRQIRESAMARRNLSSEYERLMAAMRQHADEHFGSEAAKPRGGPRTNLQWAVKNFDVSYYAEYPLRDVKLELRTNLRE